MQGKSPDQSALNLFEPALRQVTNPDHPLRVLSDSFPWNKIESDYASLYSHKGAPAKPVRLMAGLLILKYIFKGSDQGVVAEWSHDPYFQYLCGNNVFTANKPCDPSDLPRFRKRIGAGRLQSLFDTVDTLKGSSGIDRIRIVWGTRPGRDKFSYSVSAGFYHYLVKSFRSFAGRLILLKQE